MFKNKIIIFLIFFVSFFLVLEIFLRLAGFVYLFGQEKRNFAALRAKGAIKVLCIGESTTAWGGQSSYLEILGDLLNQAHSELKFSVINKGLPGTTSSYILHELGKNLDIYQPDIVIVMMGINDRMPYFYNNKFRNAQKMSFFASLRVVTLAKMIWYSMINKVAYMDPALPYPSKQDVWLSKKTFVSESMHEESFVKRAWLFKDQGDYDSAEDFFKKALMQDKDRNLASVELAHLYREEERYDEAETVLRDSLAHDPKNKDAYVGLGCVYQDRKIFSLAEEALKKGIAIDPDYVLFYIGLGFVYQEQDRYLDAQAMFNQALKIDPQNLLVYQALGGIYLEQNDLSQAQSIFRKAIAIDPNDDKGYSGLALVLKKLHKSALANQYFLKAQKLRLRRYNPLTVDNYIKFKKMLDKRNILMFCMQYPLLSVEPLKRIFSNEPGVIFIDNEDTFKTSLKFGNYKEYFTDNFGGEFGHCTALGNRLIAQNVAKAILKIEPHNRSRELQ